MGIEGRSKMTKAELQRTVAGKLGRPRSLPLATMRADLHLRPHDSPRRSYRSLASLQRDNGTCRACAEAGFPLESLPVFEGRADQRAPIVGQAPGVVEGAEGRPWRGRAGSTLRGWLGLDEEAFYRTFYCSSVTRCYPGVGCEVTVRPVDHLDARAHPAGDRECSRADITPVGTVVVQMCAKPDPAGA
jgi:hypothetical protein